MAKLSKYTVDSGAAYDSAILALGFGWFFGIIVGYLTWGREWGMVGVTLASIALWAVTRAITRTVWMHSVGKTMEERRAGSTESS